VKPANIMLTDADERVKLIDFGIVRITANYRVPTGAMPRRPTEMGTALGTPGYLPLEAGLVTPNPSFDVFGLGATLYQLLTGKLPEEPLAVAARGSSWLRRAGRPRARAGRRAGARARGPHTDRGRAGPRARGCSRGPPGARRAVVRIDGRYELIGLAGTGAKADAYLAVHRGAGHDVVLKFLRSTPR
jgi:hypothetical protein